jgi:hypothetical protein
MCSRPVERSIAASAKPWGIGTPDAPGGLAGIGRDWQGLAGIGRDWQPTPRVRLHAVCKGSSRGCSVRPGWDVIAHGCTVRYAIARPRPALVRPNKPRPHRPWSEMDAEGNRIDRWTGVGPAWDRRGTGVGSLWWTRRGDGRGSSISMAVVDKVILATMRPSLSGRFWWPHPPFI